MEVKNIIISLFGIYEIQISYSLIIVKFNGEIEKNIKGFILL